MSTLLTPSECAKALGLGLSTISRCVKAGAPVEFYGPTGSRYRIDPDKLRAWMQEQGEKRIKAEREARIRSMTTDQLAQRRLEIMKGVAK